jgi:hypothetical protein
MGDQVTLQEAKDGLESLGTWMDIRHNSSRRSGTPIQAWDIPRKEKGFFTVYTMNLVLESDGFDSLAEQEPEDVEAFIDLLHRVGAKKTAALVQRTVAALKSKTPCDENKCTSQYYKLFKQDKVWLKLLDYVGRRIYMGYYLKAQAIEDAGKSDLDPKQWKGALPNA